MLVSATTSVSRSLSFPSPFHHAFGLCFSDHCTAPAISATPLAPWSSAYPRMGMQLGADWAARMVGDRLIRGLMRRLRVECTFLHYYSAVSTLVCTVQGSLLSERSMRGWVCPIRHNKRARSPLHPCSPAPPQAVEEIEAEP